MNEPAGAMYVGIVESVQLDPSGCLRVRIPALNGIFDCRVATPLAGAGRGMIFLPEKADQVLLGSVTGSDVEFVLLGSLLSANAAPPKRDGAETNDVKLIQTRSGNLIQLVDTDGAENIEIATRHQSIRLSIKDDIISIKAKNISLDGKVDVTGTLTVGVKGTTIIDGNKITGKSG